MIYFYRLPFARGRHSSIKWLPTRMDDFDTLKSAFGYGGAWFGLGWLVWKIILPQLKSGASHHDLSSKVYENAADTINRLSARVQALEDERMEYLRQIRRLEKALSDHGIILPENPK